MTASAPQLTTTGLLRWVWEYAARRWRPLAVVVWTMLVRVVLDVLKPWPMVFLIDYVLKGNVMPAWLQSLVTSLPGSSTQTGLIAWSIGTTVLFFLLSWAIGLANAYASISLGQRMVYDLAGDLFSKLQQLSLHFHRRHSVGDTVRRVTADCACVSVIVKDALVPVVSSLLSLAVMFFVMWRINPPLTMLALAVAPYMALVFRAYAQPMMDRSYEQQQVEGRIYGLAEQVFSAIPIVQAFHRERFNDAQFQKINQDTVAATLTLTRVQLKFKILIGLATAVGTAGILWLGARAALSGSMTIGDIVLFLSYLGSLYAPLEAMMYSTSTIQSAAGSARRVWEVLQAQTDVREASNPIVPDRIRGEISIENVLFGYEPDRPVLRDVSLQVRPGEVIALVGPTGAGKSTLVSLIPRFFDPWSGKVRIDGFNVADLQLKRLRHNISIVLQESFLFPVSVAENIAYGRPGATRGEIEAAARDAHAHDFIAKLPDGYATLIGERGATLSGGERQRISIARALLKNAPILILDEPTSALDSEAEYHLLEALRRLTESRTTLIIAHRLSTIRRANRVVVLQNGGIIESGTHEELLARQQVYARFHALQFGNGNRT
jgi:ATP-binding cassette subfamily B protein/subfamily B ATP-binding cassette protein MsbA